MYDEQNNTDDRSATNRRNVLKALSTVAAGGAGLAGTASAIPSGPSFFGECEDGWNHASLEYPIIDLRTPEPTTRGNFPTGADEFLVYVHGWLEKFAHGGRSQAYTLEKALQQNGYDKPVVAAIWDSNQPVWTAAKLNADTAGSRLASWLDDYLDQYSNTTVKTVDHSLGTRVILEALATLGGAEVLDNVSAIGGAVNPDTVCSGTRYADGISASTTDFYNYHSTNDNIVCDIYARREGHKGIGCIGSDCGGDVPSNFSNVDVSSSVKAHCDYGRSDVGCVPEIVSNF